MVRRYYKRISKVYSKIEIELIHDYSSNLLKSVENHEIDACIISKREGNHKWIPLYKDKLVAWVSENHKLAKKNSISIEQLKKSLLSQPMLVRIQIMLESLKNIT